MTWENDQKRIEYFIDALENSPNYDCPSRGTVVIRTDQGVVVHEGRESLISWTNRHFAQIDDEEEREMRRRRLEQVPKLWLQYYKTISHVISK